MKKSIYIIVLLIGTICFVQDETLLEYEWKLEYIELNGETLYQPINEESDETISIAFYESPSTEGLFFFQYDLICSWFGCYQVEFATNSLFNFFSCELSIEGCSLEENVVFESDYMMVYQDLMGGGSALNPFTYSFVTEEDIIYLTITNSEGNSATYSSTTLSDTNFEDYTFSIYPNPVANKLHIKSQQPIHQVEIFNLSGKRILNEAYQENQAIDVSSLPSGMYILKKETENGSATRKLVKV